MFNLFKKKEKVIITDPTFGPITFEPNHGIDMWCRYPDNDINYLVTIVASSSGPTDAQCSFFNIIKGNLQNQFSTCIQFIGKQTDAPTDHSQLHLYAIHIGTEIDIQQGKYTIELANSDEIEIHGIDFYGGNPSTYYCDD